MAAGRRSLIKKPLSQNPFTKIQAGGDSYNDKHCLSNS
jgi:hypothetical protein